MAKRARRCFRRPFSVQVFRIIFWLLICAFFLPVPAPKAAPAKNNVAARLSRRPNSSKRSREIEGMHEEYGGEGKGGTFPSPSPHTHSPSGSRNGARADAIPLRDAPERRRSSGSSAGRPKSVSAVLFDGLAGFMGLPGLAGSGPYAPNPDQGPGSHQDGTARRADGTAGTDGGRYDGGRAATYAGHGLGSGSGGRREPGYDPATDPNYRPDDEYKGGRRADRGNGFGRDILADPQRYFLQRSLNYGTGLINSAGEAALSGLVDGGRARLNFMFDLDGRLNGEGDVLFPFHDSRYTTIYTQFGARSMSGMSGGGSEGRGTDRWIGNAGIGQRWFPQAGSLADSGDWMFGYNAFFDYDFTRSHQRGGVGVEAQYDWLRLASNYYFPLSNWRDSRDFAGDLVRERAAEGWDVRLKGYLPFYRNLAVTGAYARWRGDHVGMFSNARLEKGPRVWSYGLEYTPVPLVSGFVSQRSTERGRSDMELGLRFTYHFQMPWEDQISHSKVAALRTVSASRHEFVDRENRIILEYKAKNAYRIEYLGLFSGTHRFRLRDGFDKTPPGRSVRVRAAGTWLAGGVVSLTAVTDSRGVFGLQLDASAPNPATVTVQAGDTSQAFTLAGGGGTAAPGLTLTVSYNRTSFADADFSATATVTAAAIDANGNPVTVNNGDITWTVESSSIGAAWWGNRNPGALNGLAWGQTPISLAGPVAQRMDMGGNGGTAPDGATARLTDIVGSRTVTVKARATINGTRYERTATVTFGPGPLSVFRDKPVGSKTWAAAGNACGTAGNPAVGGYQASTKLPTTAQLQNVAGSGPGGRYGAAYAAGWPDDGQNNGWFTFWTGESEGDGAYAGVVFLDGSGADSAVAVPTTPVVDFPVAVCLP